MAFNLLPVERDQQFLMPPSIREWLREDHLAWFVLEVVDKLDLTAFYVGRREDGWGRAAYDPGMMVALLIYAYATGVRSSRVIERKCLEDVAFRVVAANQQPDHATIARFRQSYDHAMGSLFTDVLALCVQAGLVTPGVVALDGTKIEAAADPNRMASHDQLEDLARSILDEARRVDEEEDLLYGDKRGDELPEHLQDRDQRLEWIRSELDAIAKKRATGWRKTEPKVNLTDPQSRQMKVKDGFIQGYNAQAVATEDQVVLAAEVTNDGADQGQLKPMVEQTQDNLVTVGAPQGIETVVADAGYLSRDNVTTDLGCDVLIAPASAARMLGLKPPDVAANWQHYRQRIEEVEAEADRRARLMKRATSKQMTMKQVATELGISPAHAYVLRNRFIAEGRDGLRPRVPLPPREPTGRDVMAARFLDPEARQIYARRAQIIEPIFGQTKAVRGIRRFMRRGLTACDAEWKLIMATHNVLKLWRSAISAEPEPITAH